MKPYRADMVGSMLRPHYLLQAREQFAKGQLSDVDFKAIEDRAVDECISIQVRAGVDVLADGEMRRSVFASQLVQSTEGFGSVSNNSVDWFHMDGKKETSPVTVGLIGKIRRKRHLCAEEFTYLRGKTDRPTKATLPSPTMYAYYWVPGISDSAYPSAEAYLEEIAGILSDEVRELSRLGAQYIQFDAPEFGMLIDPHQQAWFSSKGFEPGKLIALGVEMINRIIEDHSGITFGLHICKGNDANRYMARGGYHSVAERIFPRTNVQRLLLEYDDERSGDFEPLKHVRTDTYVVLGLISTKISQMETAEEVQRRIHDASRFIPLERLALSPQCGFASVARGNDLPFEVQESKLRLVAEVARKTWED